MTQKQTGLHIMGCCAGILVGTSIGAGLGENTANPYLYLVIGVVGGFLAGFFLTYLIIRLRKMSG